MSYHGSLSPSFRVVVGKEVFDVELTIRLPSGILESAVAVEENPIDFEERTCRHAALSDCDAPKKARIVRSIHFSLEQ